eukprot:CAMPEP_0179426022 /NCGR_PEP_ID=MMETSP0799-20121207/12503_1 /TAXON_ID=46947 /ORGANISM="Geminigera cryophila, Strain CCMP2564" /LENGTH=277 /DNA_ID=CAMNT_0021200719 /DNA_START=29 /DNA_END=862 /DNA_ORIENTATION=+
MTPRTENRRHMQGKSSATSSALKRPLFPPSVPSRRGPSPRTDEWIQLQNTDLPANMPAQRSRTPIPGGRLNRHGERDTNKGPDRRVVSSDPKPCIEPSNATMSNGRESPSVLGGTQRGTWVASSAGGPRFSYDDKKSGFLTGVETGVTAMRGAAGWRRQLELAASKVYSSSREPSPDGRARSPAQDVERDRGVDSMGAWMDPHMGANVQPMSMSSWMTPGGVPEHLPQRDDFGDILAPPIDFVSQAEVGLDDGTHAHTHVPSSLDAAKEAMEKSFRW